VAAAKAVAAWPDGNEVDSGIGISGTTDDSSATGGLARSVTSLMRATDSAAAPAARLAESAQRRDAQRGRASPSAPKAAIRGHLTHQADATTKMTVSGSQRMVWVASIAKSSSSTRRWNTVRSRW
jgi:hypothetical protein